MSSAEIPAEAATVDAVVGRALVNHVARLERSNAQLRARADATTAERDALAVELQRLDRLGTVRRYGARKAADGLTLTARAGWACTARREPPEQWVQ